MVPNGTAYDNYPSFANSGTRTMDTEGAKYAQGFVPSDTFPAEWANYFFHGATAGITRLNQDVGSIKKELNSILEAYNITNNSSLYNQLLGALSKIYPQFASCTTAASTEVKSIAVEGNVLKAGNIYVIDMTYGNTYGDGLTTYPKLSINSGTAYPLCDANGAYLKSGSWIAGQTIKVLFTGVKYLMATGIVDYVESGNKNAVSSDAVSRAVASLIGEIKIWPAVTPPTGWIVCDGRELSRTTYSALFNIIGITYGTGDGLTTFNIPDFREIVLVGAGHNRKYIFDSSEKNPSTGLDGTQTHDEYSVGQFKDDQFQGHWHRFSTNGNDKGKSGMHSAYGGGDGPYDSSTYPNGILTPQSMANMGNVRYGTTTHGKQVGVNYIIKAI